MDETPIAADEETTTAANPIGGVDEGSFPAEDNAPMEEEQSNGPVPDGSEALGDGAGNKDVAEPLEASGTITDTVPEGSEAPDNNTEVGAYMKTRSGMLPEVRPENCQQQQAGHGLIFFMGFQIGNK